MSLLSSLIDAFREYDLDPTAEDLADILWLTAQMGSATYARAEALPPRIPVTTGGLISPPGDDNKDTSLDANSYQTSRTDAKADTRMPQAKKSGKATAILPPTSGVPGDQSGVGGLPFRSPGAPGLPDALNLGRALRPLKRRVPSRTQFVLDEEATVRRIVETSVWAPVVRPAPARWLDVVLVVDESSSMVVWRQTVTELRRLLEQHGAFRTVQTWHIIPETGSHQARLSPDVRTAAVSAARSPRELLDSLGRRLILVVSDCVAPYWYNDVVREWLVMWGQQTPVVLVQMLPEALWGQTSLGYAQPVDIYGGQLGLPNIQLIIKRMRRIRTLATGEMVLPVVTLQSEMLGPWAEVLAGSGRWWLPGYVLPAKGSASVSMDLFSEFIPNDLNQARRLTHDFLNQASPHARELIGYLAAVPLSLPIMRLVQHVMFGSRARQVHLAEVLVSGLIRQEQAYNPALPADEIRYDFLPYVNDILRDTVQVDDIERVLSATSNFIDDKSGQLIDFQAVLADPSLAGRIRLDEQSQRFADIAVSTLRRFGGKYARLAEQLSNSAWEKTIAGLDSSSYSHTGGWRPNYYALLIGIDFYFPGQLPGGGYYPSLGGCVRDVNHVEAYLKQRLKLPDAQILKLSATNSATSKPPEPADQLPTYENMVAKFKELKTMAQAGDYVYIHYSGHGGRTKTIYPDLKGADGIDETLVPTDIHNTNAHYLRDVELAYLLQEMVAQGLRVTLVLDSCHSGGATRGVGGAVARGVSFVDNTDRPADSAVASVDELAANWQHQTGGATRSGKPASGWLPEPKGYTLIAACRANESAYEYAFDGRERNGALTYWLLDSLRQAGPDFSYKMIHDRILAKVHGLFDQQTPQLQGEGNLAVFGSDLIDPYYAVGVIKVQNGQVQLDAGAAHGLTVGAQFAVYPFGTTDLNTEAGRVALVTLERVEDLVSWAKVVEQIGDKPVEEGAQAVLLNNVNLRLQRNVALIMADAARQQQLRTAIAADGKGFIKVAGAGEQVDFQVTVNDAGEYELWDPAGKVIPNLRPALRAQDASALQRLVGRLIHLAKYRNVQELDVANPSARQMLRVELLGASDTAGETPIFHPGDRFKFKISNTQAPNPADPKDPKRILNICVLELQSDWGITQIYPAGAGTSEIVDPGKGIEIELEAYLPDSYTEKTNVLKVFATQATTNFRWLELPVLDQPDTR